MTTRCGFRVDTDDIIPRALDKCSECGGLTLGTTLGKIP